MSRFVIAFTSRSLMTTVTILSNCGAKENSACHSLHMFTCSICWVVMGPDALIFVFMNVEFSVRFFTLLIHHHPKALYFLHFLLFSVLPSTYLRLLMFLQTTLLQPLIQSPGILIVYSAFDSHKQSDNMDLCHSPLPVLNWSIFPCLVPIFVS